MNANLRRGDQHTGPETTDDAAIAAAVQRTVFTDYQAPHPPGTFTDVDVANEFLARVAANERLEPAYVMPCAALVDQAAITEVSGRIVVCIPAEPDAHWSRVAVLHQLAHLGGYGHGPRWAGEFVRLTRLYLSRAAGDRLDWEFHRAGILPQVSGRNVAQVAAAG